MNKQVHETVRNAYAACIAGAMGVDRYQSLVEQAGFRDVRVTVKATSSCISADTPDPIGQAVVKEYGGEVPLGDLVASVYVEARREGRQVDR